MNASDYAAQADAARIAANTNAWMARNRADGGVCDFCCHLLGDQPPVTYVTEQPIISILGMIDPDTLGAASIVDYQDPYWAACPDCDPVVQSGDADVLASHVWTHRDADRIGVPVERLDNQDELNRLTELYAAFYARNPARHEGVVRGDDDVDN